MASSNTPCKFCGTPGHASLDCSGALMVLASGAAPDEVRPEEKAIVKDRPKVANVRVFTENCEPSQYCFDIAMPEAGDTEKFVQAQIIAEARALGVPPSVFNPANGEMGYVADGAGWPESAHHGSIKFGELQGAESFGVVMNHP